MIDNKDNSKKSMRKFDKLFDSLDTLLAEEREQRLKLKLAKEIKKDRKSVV